MRYDLRTKPIDDAIVAMEEHGPVRFFDYQPGNGTRYALMILRLDDNLAKTRASVGLGNRTPGLMLSWLNHDGRSMFIDEEGGFLAPHYVQEKLGCTLSDAVVLAELVAHVTPREAYSSDEFNAQAAQADADTD